MRAINLCSGKSKYVTRPPSLSSCDFKQTPQHTTAPRSASPPNSGSSTAARSLRWHESRERACWQIATRTTNTRQTSTINNVELETPAVRTRTVVQLYSLVLPDIPVQRYIRTAIMGADRGPDFKSSSAWHSRGQESVNRGKCVGMQGRVERGWEGASDFQRMRASHQRFGCPVFLVIIVRQQLTAQQQHNRPQPPDYM